METETITLDALFKEIKALRKDLRKVRAYIEDPTGEKTKARVANNGFNKPLGVTEKLRTFLGLAADEKISRSQVTIRINAYVTEKGLKAGQVITLDQTLQDLLQVPEGTQVTFLNIQKYINPHYLKEPKAVKEPTVAAVAATTPEPPKEKKLRPKVAKA